MREEFKTRGLTIGKTKYHGSNTKITMFVNGYNLLYQVKDGNKIYDIDELPEEIKSDVDFTFVTDVVDRCGRY